MSDPWVSRLQQPPRKEAMAPDSSLLLLWPAGYARRHVQFRVEAVTLRMALALSCVLAAASGCSTNQLPEHSNPDASQTFTGVLPCADCAGIRHELTLHSDQHSGQPLTYALVQTYLGTRDGDRTFK